MALFGNNRESQRMAAMREVPKPVEELEMLIEYYDKTTETISITFNPEELQQLVGNSLSTGASMNFPNAQPPFVINPRWVKKVTFAKRQ
ncbi:thiopurine S-methyltransferase [Streptococcus anginosus]|uniref:thiopurine S-methyltransferase n=1 Tax=Streptococcus anginosus TaxID=1328 RepID=UPI0029C2DEB6|nr:thiopurine S-methyltransferase [Streptococcus anginosus]MDX5016346.1 thiopurine S-methyltransferase [Streptococcus anginosus]MDX5020410.1 thiopurine S-methyltransferase [Streptococcus anginosus]